MIRLRKISGVFKNFTTPMLDKIGISRVLHAEAFVSLIVVLAMVTFAVGVSVISSDVAVTAESLRAETSETPGGRAVNADTVAADDGSNSAQSGGFPITVNAPIQNVTAGTDVTVDVTVSGINAGMSVISWQANILFDPAVLLPWRRICNHSGNDRFAGGSGVLTVNPFRSGKLKMAFTDPFGLCAGAPCPDGSILVKLRFIVIGPIGSNSPLRWERVPGGGNLVFDFNGDTANANAIDGRLDVVAPAGPLPVGATPFGTPIVGTLDATDTTRDNRLLRNSIFSGCTAKTCPGALGVYPVATISPSPTATATATPIVTTYPPGINTYRYDVIPFTNTTGQPQNFTFTTTVTGPGSVLPAIYAAPYSPTGIACQPNYRGDPGGGAVPGGPVVSR